MCEVERTPEREKNIHIILLAGNITKQIECINKVTFIVWNSEQSAVKVRMRKHWKNWFKLISFMQSSTLLAEQLALWF